MYFNQSSTKLSSQLYHLNITYSIGYQFNYTIFFDHTKQTTNKNVQIPFAIPGCLCSQTNNQHKHDTACCIIFVNNNPKKNENDSVCDAPFKTTNPGNNDPILPTATTLLTMIPTRTNTVIRKRRYFTMITSLPKFNSAKQGRF